MKIFETHTHLDDEAFDMDRTSLIEEMLGADGTIDYIINVGASLRGCVESIKLAADYEKIYAAIGVHPEEVSELKESDIEWLIENATTNDKIVAIGEIGLDYHYEEPVRDIQKYWFDRQLQAAYQIRKPVIIHSREACQDTIDMLKSNHANELGGIIHCYSYSKEAARDYLNMGFHIGIGGVVTFKNARKLVEAVEYIPLDKIVLETDCPYMAPEPHRGKRNDSRNLQYVAAKIGEIKGLSPQEVIDATNYNARKLFIS